MREIPTAPIVVEKIAMEARSLSTVRRPGMEIAVADMSDVERVADTLKDVQRAYFCPPFDPYMIQGTVAFAVAAKEARLEHIVGLTQWLASPSHPSLMTRQLWLVDRLFSMTPGVTHTIVNPGFFADAYLVMTGIAAQLGVVSLDLRQ
jgi:NAD(P)H dehydrogenase (quinone)